MRIKSFLCGSQSLLVSLSVHLLLLILLAIFKLHVEEEGALIIAASTPSQAEAELALATPIDVPLEFSEIGPAPDEYAVFDEPSRETELATPDSVDIVEIAPAPFGLDVVSIPLNVEIKATDYFKSLLDSEAIAALPGSLGITYREAIPMVARSHRKVLRELQSLSDEHILVLQGSYDQIEAVLSIYAIPHRVVDAVGEEDLKEAKVLCLNCGSPQLDRGLIRSWVADGGLIVSSDYAVATLAAGFNDYVAVAPSASNDEVVSVEAQGRSNLMQGVFRDAKAPQWWLETSTHFIEVRDSQVKVLVTSDEMAKRHETSNVVACHFSHGRGHVLHLVGHFHQKRGNVDGLVTMHRLIFNFLAPGER